MIVYKVQMVLETCTWKNLRILEWFSSNWLIFIQGFFGQDCNSICTCQNGGTCDHVTGSCICPPGVKGTQCEDGCPPGLFGQDCDKQCPRNCPSGYCDRLFGFCECLPGFFGPACNLPCPDFTFGANCNQQCDCYVANTAKCNPKVKYLYMFSLESILRA